MFKEFRQWRKERKARLEIAAGNKEYLINAVDNISWLKKFIEQCNANPDLIVTLWTSNGARFEIKTVSRGEKRGIRWDAQ